MTYNMRCFVIFVTAVCVLFLFKLKWPKNKSAYTKFNVPLRATCNTKMTTAKHWRLQCWYMYVTHNIQVVLQKKVKDTKYMCNFSCGQPNV